MYDVSGNYLTAMSLPAQKHRITGNIYGSGGTLVQSIDNSNIAEDSFSITNQCTNTNELVFGSCYIGELNCEFEGVSLDFGQWIGKTIEPYFGIYYNGSWIDIPLGVYTVKEANHTENGVAVVTYDNMCKLDAEIPDANMTYLTSLKSDNMYTFAYYVCSQCGVALGMTIEEFNALPNATSSVANIEIYGDTSDNEQFANDITTYRDLMYWIAQTMCCFCTCDRYGDIVFRKFPKTETPDVVIQPEERLEGMSLADYVTHITGIYVTDLDTNKELYYGYDAAALEQEIIDVNADISQVDSDLLQLEIDYQQGQITEAEYKKQKKILTNKKKSLNKRLDWLEKAYESATYAKASSIELGPNPFLMYGGKRTTMNTHRRKVLKNALALSYTPFSMDVVCGWHYDLGDIIQISGGRFNSTSDSFCCIMSYTFNLHGVCTLEGFGENPAMAKVKSKASKQANTANTNAVNAKEISSGTDTPDNDEGKNNDVYIKYANHVTKTPKYSVSKGGTVDQQTGQIYRRPVDEVDFIDFELSEQTGYYSMSLRGYAYSHIWAHDDPSMYANGWYGLPMLKVRFTQAGDYKMVCDAEWEAGSDTVGWWSIPGWSSPTNSKCITNDWSSTPTELAHFTNGDHGEQHYEIDYHVDASLLNQDVYIWLDCMPVIASPAERTAFGMNIRNFRFEYVTDPGTGTTDGGINTNTEKYIDHVYVKTEDETGTEVWKEIEYVAGADTTQNSGLSLNYKRWLSLTPEVMRAIIKADPPQADVDFNRYCIRYTGEPDKTVSVEYEGATAWSNTSGYPKVTKEHVFTIKNSGAHQSGGTVQQIAYKITGLSSGQKYWFNFWARFTGAEFGEDFRKGLGLVWSTSNSISTDDWEGDPHTYNDTTKYLSFYRVNGKRYYEAGVTVTAETMYMILTVGDLTDGNDITFTMGDVVISQSQKKYARSIYIYDVATETWIKYKPFGASDDDGESEISYLNELNDVEINNASNGQFLVYNNGDWINSDMPIASASSVGGIKVGQNLTIDADGTLNATGGGSGDYTDLTNKPSINSVTLTGNKTTRDLGMIQELTQAEYDVLSSTEKNNPDKVYYIKDAGGSGGGGGGGTGGTLYGTTAPTSSEGDDGNIYTQNSDYDVKVYTKADGEWYLFNTIDKPTQEYNTANDTPIYDTTHHFGYDGSYTYNALTNDYTSHMNEGWSSYYSCYYDYEDMRYAYAGYELASPIQLSKVKVWLGRYEYQNTTLTFTLQVQTSQGGQWVDVEDMEVTESLPYPVNVFEIAVHQTVYGVRLYHYKAPDKSSGNNACFFGMKLYELV